MRGTLAIALAGSLLLALCGCQTDSLPAISPAMASAAAAKGGSLQNGRAVLSTRCISCHGIQPIANYSPTEWTQIVAKMAPRAKLSKTEERDLLAFILAARGSAQ